jgi:thioredoxin-dependent peroxiredoxin
MRAIMSIAAALVLAAASGRAADQPRGVNVGDSLPVFSATDDQGKTWHSTDHVGKKVLVIYFYPGDFTGGCTKQACAYRDDMSKLTDKGVEVIGISGDTPRTHELFKKDKHLNFTLLADENGAIARQFGVPTTPGGKASATTADGQKLDITRTATDRRWTFIINKDGKVVYKNDKVDAPADSKHVLEILDKQ